MPSIEIIENNIIDGTKIAKQILQEVKEEINKHHYHPRLAALIVGDNQGCYTYQRYKEKKCAEVGIKYSLYAFQNPPNHEIVKEKIIYLNEDPDITGVMVQLPLPSNYNENAILELIPSNKDVDGLNYINVARSYYNSEIFVPCAAEGIMRLLHEYKVDISSKKAIVLGRGRLLGSPVAQLLENENAFVTKIHSVVNAEDIRRELSNADIVISATGTPQMINAEMLKEGVVAIDCANTKDEREFHNDVFDKASHISTVPGGIGPMTIAILLKNTLKAYKINNGLV